MRTVAVLGLAASWLILEASPGYGATVVPGTGGILEQADRERWSPAMREGARLIAAGRDAEALEQFTRAADGGELIASHMLGVMYRDARGTDRDLVRAKKCFEKAASEENPLSSQELALLKFAAPATPDEFAQARALLEKLADEGYSRPQLQLGIALLEGYGFRADAVRGITMLTAAARGDGHGKAEAAFRLGRLYRDGRQEPAVQADAAKAESWLRAAAREGHRGGLLALGEYYVSPRAGRQDFGQARVHFLRLERLGDPAGSYQLGRLSENGWGREKDQAEALSYYRKAAAGDLPLAHYKLGQFHEHGWGGLEKDVKKAAAHYRQGAERGLGVCMYNLAGLLDEAPDSSATRDAEVLSWLLRAAASGMTEAEFKIGARYQAGTGVKQDFVAAAAWFDRAARAGHAPAQLHLGEMYEHGHGVKLDYQSARRLFQLAAANGHLGGQVKYAVALANGIGGPPDLVLAYLYATLATLAAPDAEMPGTVRAAIRKAMTPEQVARAEKKLAEVRPAHGGKGGPEDQGNPDGDEGGKTR